MASKRMFSEKILESDAFIDMQLQSQILYVHLCMAADDDGFIGSPNRVTRMIGAEKKHYEELLNKRFILSFPSGVCVIKHWLINNTIKKDRYVETVYREEKEILTTKDNSSYTERKQNGNKMEPIMETKWNQNGSEIVPQVRLGKNSIDKSSIDKTNNTAEIENFFESIWKLYPVKQGKGSISDKQKKILYNLGYDAIKKCVDRYMATNPKEGFVKHGSTFFNSGYIDYLDENFIINKPEPKKQEEPKSRYSYISEEEQKYFFDIGAFCIEPDEYNPSIMLECVDYGKLTEKERLYLQEKGVI